MIVCIYICIYLYISIYTYIDIFTVYILVYYGILEFSGFLFCGSYGRFRIQLGDTKKGIFWFLGYWGLLLLGT